MKEWKEYLNREITCTCGKKHRCNIEDIIIEEGALLKLPMVLGKFPYKKICVVSDMHTEEAAGRQVKEILKDAGVAFTEIVFEEEELVPDERVTGSLIIDLPLGCDLILAVGTGTLNDLCKLVSSKLGIDYFIIATAASMDGFSSNVAALIVKNLKTTYEVGRPKVIIGDLDILCKAPLTMTAAGAADILGKYVCLLDWRISNLVTGEYYCPYVESMIRESLEAVVNAIDGVASGDKQAVGAIMEALVLCGIAMSYVGNSRPASGSEHHLSHYWEMMSLFSGSHGALHGTKVGIGTVIGLRLYQYFAESLVQPDEENMKEFDKKAWEKEIRAAYLQAAPQVLLLENKVQKNGNEEVAKRREVIRENADQIRDLIRTLPKPEMIIGLLKKMNAPYLPGQIGVGSLWVRNSVLYAKDLRNRFGLLQILFDLQINENLADKIVEEFSCRD